MEGMISVPSKLLLYILSPVNQQTFLDYYTLTTVTALLSMMTGLIPGR